MWVQAVKLGKNQKRRKRGTGEGKGKTIEFMRNEVERRLLGVGEEGVRPDRRKSMAGEQVWLKMAE